MRIALSLPLLMALAGCQAEGDPHNNQVTLQYNAEVAENALEGAANEAARLGDAVANEFEREGARADNSLTADGRRDEPDAPSNAN